MINSIIKNRWGGATLSQALKLFALATLLIFTGCGGGGSSGTSATTTVTALDGYIKNANLTDGSGQTGTYTSQGKYTFANAVTYPLVLTGGALEDTNASFDITLLSGSGLVISPITSFVESNATLKTKLENIFGANLEENYIDTNNTDLAKLSQLLYAMHKDSTLLSAFKTRVASNNPADLNALFAFAQADVNATMGPKARSYRGFLNKVNGLGMATSGYEVALKSKKAALGSIQVPVVKTGQTTIYYANDDGDLQRGIARSYTDNGDGTITDNTTTLMWQKEDDNNTYNWADAKSYCSNLSLASKSDWRLPSIEELRSIVDLGKTNPAIDIVFTNTNSSGYWSSTTVASGTSSAWGVHFNGGNDGWGTKTNDGYVRCVR